MILQVFKNIGDRLLIADAYARMIAVYSGQLYPEKKAAGSIGGGCGKWWNYCFKKWIL